jgi:hypothetical protein
MRGSGLLLARFAPFAAGNIFEEDVTGMSAAADQTPARKFANQLNYSNSKWFYKAGGTAPEFYGYSGIGWGEGGEGFATVANMEAFTPTIIVAPPGAPTQKVTFVNAAGEPEGELSHYKLQTHFNEVPMPRAWTMPSGQFIDGSGTDKVVVIFQPSTGQMWEMWKVKGAEGAYTFQAGGYVSEYGKWNGIFTLEPDGKTVWGASASGLAIAGGVITLSDMVRVLNGGTIGHAISVSLPVLGGESEIVAPATKGQPAIHKIPEKHGGEAGTNPAWPNKDQIDIGSCFRFPPASRASEYEAIKDPVEIALYEAIREHGAMVKDGGGSAAVYIESSLVLGSPYSQSRISPWVGADSVSKKYETANAVGYAARTNPAQPTIKKPPGGTGSFLFNLFDTAGRTLEVLVPRSS